MEDTGKTEKTERPDDVQNLTGELNRYMENKKIMEPDTNTSRLVEAVLDSYERYPISTRLHVSSILNRNLIIDVTEKIRQILFPGITMKTASAENTCATSSATRLSIFSII